MTVWAERELHGWGRYPRVTAECARPEERREAIAALADREDHPVLAFGLGRSYGDTALLSGGRVILTERLDRMLDFDPETGWLRCEAGVSLRDIIAVFAPRGWYPAVVPGTCFVTVGGAVANDIHGKNHHVDGTFADHVRRVELLTATGEIVRCDAETEPELFWATVGGMGLTGLMLALDVRLVPIESEWIEMESIRVRNLDHFFEVSSQSSDYTHTVSWIDNSARGASTGRGLFMRGRWAPASATPKTDLLSRLKQWADPFLDLPIDAPGWLLNAASIMAFNEVIYRKQLEDEVHTLVHNEPFFFPLDFVRNWNRGYGARGFLQYQLVVPHDPEHRAIRGVLEEIRKAGIFSFLAVIKEFGDRPHGGLSFPEPGVTLAMDFPNTGRSLLELFERFDRIVLDGGGKLYLGKDARLGRDTFRRMYPEWERWKAVRDHWDPDLVFQSDLGHRLGLCGRE